MIIQRLLLLVLLCAYIPVEAKYYRWTDENGKVHYSFSVPADKSKLGHTELNKQGLQQKKVASAKRKKQLQQIEEIRKQEQEEAAKLKKEEEARQAADNMLLTVFNTEDELVKAYSAKLNLAQVTIDLLKSRHKKQSEKLRKMEKRYNVTKNIKHKQKLEKQIDDVLENLKVYQDAITDSLSEKDKVKAEYENTLARFRKLQNRSAKSD